MWELSVIVDGGVGVWVWVWFAMGVLRDGVAFWVWFTVYVVNMIHQDYKLAKSSLRKLLDMQRADDLDENRDVGQ